MAKCPFCKGKPSAKQRGVAHWVECSRCGATALGDIDPDIAKTNWHGRVELSRNNIEKMTPCPVCAYRGTVRRSGLHYYVECLGCYSMGIATKSEKEAINRWNEWDGKR